MFEQATTQSDQLSDEMKVFKQGNVTTFYTSGIYAISTDVPDDYAGGKVDYGYVVADENGNETIKWVGKGNLELLMESMESGLGSGLGLIRKMNEQFGFTDSLADAEGLEAFTAGISNIETFLETGAISLEDAQAQCVVYTEWLQSLAPGYPVERTCDCLGANLTVDNSCLFVGNASKSATAIWTGYVFHLIQNNPFTGASAEDELDCFENSIFAPLSNGGILSFSAPCLYFPSNVTTDQISALLAELDESGMEATLSAEAETAARQAKEDAQLKIAFNMTSQEITYALIVSETADTASTDSLPLSRRLHQMDDLLGEPTLGVPGVHTKSGGGRRLSFVRELSRDVGGHLVPWKRSSSRETADTLITTKPGATIFDWSSLGGDLTIEPRHIANGYTGVAGTTQTSLQQAAFRLCASENGQIACNVVTMIADPTNEATLQIGSKRLQLELAILFDDIPSTSSSARYDLAQTLQTSLAQLFGIRDYRVLVRDFVRNVEATCGAECGSLATFDVLEAATAGEWSPQDVADTLQDMLNDPNSTLLNSAPEGSIFLELGVVAGSEVRELNNGTFVLRSSIPPPPPPPPTPYPPPLPPTPPGPAQPLPTTTSSPSPPAAGTDYPAEIAGGDTKILGLHSDEFGSAVAALGLVLVCCAGFLCCLVIRRQRSKKARKMLTIAENSSSHLVGAAKAAPSKFVVPLTGAPAPAAAKPTVSFSLGERVVHGIHGQGTVTEVMPDGRTRVVFDNGEMHRYKNSSLPKMISRWERRFSMAAPKKSPLQLGERVVHETHGLGKVAELMDDGRTRIEFDNGEEHRYKNTSLQKVFALGSRVIHDSRGGGTVVEFREDGRTRVTFDNGEDHSYYPSRVRHDLEEDKHGMEKMFAVGRRQLPSAADQASGRLAVVVEPSKSASRSVKFLLPGGEPSKTGSEKSGRRGSLALVGERLRRASVAVVAVLPKRRKKHRSHSPDGASLTTARRRKGESKKAFAERVAQEAAAASPANEKNIDVSLERGQPAVSERHSGTNAASSSSPPSPSKAHRKASIEIQRFVRGNVARKRAHHARAHHTSAHQAAGAAAAAPARSQSPAGSQSPRNAHTFYQQGAQALTRTRSVEEVPQNRSRTSAGDPHSGRVRVRRHKTGL